MDNLPDWLCEWVSYITKARYAYASKKYRVLEMNAHFLRKVHSIEEKCRLFDNCSSFSGDFKEMLDIHGCYSEFWCTWILISNAKKTRPNFIKWTSNWDLEISL